MNFLIFYVFLYCNADDILNKLYFSKFVNNTYNTELITANPHFYYAVTQQTLFIFCIYSLFIIKNFMYYNSINKYSITLAFVYIKYLLNILLNDNMRLCDYEINRYIMWAFATPLMLKMYSNVNNVKLLDINMHYHLVPTILNVIIYPYYKNPFIHYTFIGGSSLSLLYFLRTLYCRNDFFTNIFIFIWSMFIIISIIEVTGISDKYNINFYYLCADAIAKTTTIIIVNDYNEREIIIMNNMDIQSIQFVSQMLRHIKQYYSDNITITKKCADFIEFTKRIFVSKMPANKDVLKNELLSKILPFGLDNECIENTTIGAIPNAKQFDMVCVLFTDIVNYTELAKQYDDKIIFNLLNRVYTKFDTIIKKYSHLQKIETIGDAYMVVGDIYRNSNNHTIVIKEIILLSLDFLKEIKTIETPDNIPLSIRIGINIGNVSIGILGNEIPRLCVVGNTVNITSRLQATADVDTIQLSRDVYEQLENIEFDIEFTIINKENVFLKNIGSVVTYTIMRQPLSMDNNTNTLSTSIN